MAPPISLARMPLDGILSTKLAYPAPRGEVVPRPRLIERLVTGVRGPLTLVAASAGFGKTTLVNAWRASSPLPIAWLALDPADGDLARFLRYLVESLRLRSPEIGTSLLPTLRSLQRPNGEALMGLLINELNQLSSDIVLVLDDYHVVESPPIHQALTSLLERMPPRLRLVIITRTDPPLPLPRLRARGLLTEIREADLRFTPAEAAAFLRDSMSVPLASTAVAALVARTEGWITGLQLAALSLRAIHEPADVTAFIASFTGGHRYVVDYLAEEVLSHLSEPVQRFLLRTSILDRLSGPLCDALTDQADGQATLEQIERRNLFVVPLDDHREWYRYHHLFADFLRERLRRQQPSLERNLARRACAWYARRGDAAEAARYAADAGEMETAAQLLEHVTGAYLWRHGEPTTVLRWLERLPDENIRRRPRLSLDRAWALLWCGRIADVEPHLADIEHILAGSLLTRSADAASSVHAPPDTANRALLGEIATLRSVLARYRGDAHATIALASRGLELLPGERELLRGVATGLRGVGYRLNGDFVEAERAFGEAAERSRSARNIVTALIALGRAVDIRAWLGHLRQAAETYRQALNLAAKEGLPTSPALGIAHVGMARVLYERDDLAAAESILQRGVDGCEQWLGVLAEFAVDGWLQLARIALVRGDHECALERIGHAERISAISNSAPDMERVAVMRASAWLARGDVRAASRWVTAWLARPRAADEPALVRLEVFSLYARLLVAHGTPAELTHLLDQLTALTQGSAFERLCLDLHVLRALAAAHRGAHGEALDLLEQVLEAAQPEGYVRLFADWGEPLATLLGALRASGRGSPTLTRVLAAMPAITAGAMEHVPDVTVAADTAIPALPVSSHKTAPAHGLLSPLSARELEVVRLLASGRSTGEIAEALVLNPGTVKNHLKHIFGKLDAHTRLQAVERARAHQLL